MDIVRGPAGGPGGHAFEGYTIPAGTQLKEIHVFADQYVYALQFVYSDGNGGTEALPKIGGLGGAHYVFALDDDEQVTGISGLCDWYIDSLRFHTNKRVSEYYGGVGAKNEFRQEVPEGHAVVGFFGRADWFIDALGIIARPAAGHSPAQTPATQSNGAEAHTTVEEPPVAQSTVVEPPVAQSTSVEPEGVVMRTPRASDLEKVEGIGPKIAGLLIEAGIYDLTDLSNTPVERLKEILKAAGSRYAIADPTTWPEQAAYGAKGDWEGMQTFQKQLVGGRRG